MSAMSTPDLRYPVGPFEFGLPVSASERPLYLSQVAEAPAKLRAAVAHLSDAQLDTPYRPGGWTFVKWSTTFRTRTSIGISARSLP